MKVFLDANIFFAAAGSPKGGSAFILELAKQRKIKIVTVMHAIIEAERNIQKKLNEEALNRHHRNLLAGKPEIQPLPVFRSGDIHKLAKLLPQKDVPILLGAILSNSEFLITLDRKDFLKNEKLRRNEFNFQMLNPGEFLNKFISD